MMRCPLILVAALWTVGAASAADKTPFQGGWVPKGQVAECDSVGISGDGFTIDDRTIGSGDTVCTIKHIDRRGQSFFLRLDCHGLNRSFAGTKYARIDRLSASRIMFSHRGEPATEMVRCPPP